MNNLNKDKEKTNYRYITYAKFLILLGAIAMWFWGESYGPIKPDSYIWGLSIFCIIAFSLLNLSWHFRHKKIVYTICGFLFIAIIIPLSTYGYLNLEDLPQKFWTIVISIAIIIIGLAIILQFRFNKKEDNKD